MEGPFDALRFEDAKGDEEILVHAQLDMNEEMENDHTVKARHDEHRPQHAGAESAGSGAP